MNVCVRHKRCYFQFNVKIAQNWNQFGTQSGVNPQFYEKIAQNWYLFFKWELIWYLKCNKSPI